MKIASKSQLSQMVKSGQVGHTIAQQIASEMKKANKKSLSGSPLSTKSIVTKTAAKRSPAELALRPVLAGHFGWWHEGGELVEELEPFKDRKVRVDFALPRWQIYIEVDGWSHHGARLESHHKDRARALVFSARNWLPFRVSYQQAINEGEWLIECLTGAMALREPTPVNTLRVEVRETAKGHRRRLKW